LRERADSPTKLRENNCILSNQQFEISACILSIKETRRGSRAQSENNHRVIIESVRIREASTCSISPNKKACEVKTRLKLECSDLIFQLTFQLCYTIYNSRVF